MGLINFITRRGFLRAAAAAGAPAVLPPLLPRARAATAPPPLARDPWRKRGRILDSDASGLVQNFTSPAYPLDDGRWRLWLSVSGKGIPFNVGYAEGIPGQRMERRLATLGEGDPPDAPLAIGNLPRDWRPVQPVHVRLGDGRHRLYFWAHGPGVVRYLAAESDDGRRYRVIDPSRACLYHPGDRAVDESTAAEAGLSRLARKKTSRPSSEPPAPARLVSNDATNVYRLDDGTFEMYSVALVEVAREHPGYIAHDNCAGRIRVIDRYTSADGLDWNDRRRVIAPDTRDPADQQFYYLSVTHTPRGRIGMLGHYRVGAQTIDIEACHSTDGIEWHRKTRAAWIPRGTPDEIDSVMTYAPHALVQRDGLWHLFYTGANYTHNHQRSNGTPSRAVFLATCENPWA